MRTVIETRNIKGETVSRTEAEIANLGDAEALLISALDDIDISRVIIFEDLRPEDVTSLTHDPRYFSVRVDAQRNPETNEVEFIGESWS